MRRSQFYRLLTLFCLWAAGAAVVLLVVGLVLQLYAESSAAALCALVFFIPGLVFLRYYRRLYVRDLALTHAAKLAEEAGVTDIKTISRRLDVGEDEASKILQIAIREGHLSGEIDAKGRFVSATAPRCPSCGVAVPRASSQGACPSCGRPMTEGG